MSAGEEEMLGRWAAGPLGRALLWGHLSVIMFCGPG